MKYLLKLVLITLLLTIGATLDFGQIGIVCTGKVELLSSIDGSTTSITFDIAYTQTPAFGITLAGYHSTTASSHRILHQTSVNNTNAKITWNVSSTVYKIKVFWASSSDQPLSIQQFSRQNVQNSVGETQTLSSNVQASTSYTVRQVLLISGF